MKSGILKYVGMFMLAVCAIGSIAIGNEFDSFWIGAGAFTLSLISLLPWFAIDKILEYLEEMKENSHKKVKAKSISSELWLCDCGEYNSVSYKKCKACGKSVDKQGNLEEAEESVMSEDSVPLSLDDLVSH